MGSWAISWVVLGAGCLPLSWTLSPRTSCKDSMATSTMSLSRHSILEKCRIVWCKTALLAHYPGLLHGITHTPQACTPWKCCPTLSSVPAPSGAAAPPQSSSKIHASPQKTLLWLRQRHKIKMAESMPPRRTIVTYKKWIFFKMVD